MRSGRGSRSRYAAAFITARSISPAIPCLGLRVLGDGRHNSAILGGSTPDEASGIWPEPVWRVEHLDGAERCSSDWVTQHRVAFKAGTIVAMEPSWRWFGTDGRQIEQIAQTTLALPPASLRTAIKFGSVPHAWLAHPPAEDPLRHLSESIQSGIWWSLREKAEREDPASGEEVMYGGGCVFLWEIADPGWVAAEMITNVAMRAVLLADRLSAGERQARTAPWRALVGEPAALAVLA